MVSEECTASALALATGSATLLAGAAVVSSGGGAAEGISGGGGDTAGALLGGPAAGLSTAVTVVVLGCSSLGCCLGLFTTTKSTIARTDAASAMISFPPLPREV